MAEAALLQLGDTPLDAETRLIDPIEHITSLKGLIKWSRESRHDTGQRQNDYLRRQHFSSNYHLITGKPAVFSFSSQAAHAYLTDCCILSLLHIGDVALTVEYLDENPLLRYSAQHWFTHARQAQDDDPALEERVHALLSQESTLFNWLRICDPFRGHRALADRGVYHQFSEARSHFSMPLFYAAALGLRGAADASSMMATLLRTSGRRSAEPRSTGTPTWCTSCSARAPTTRTAQGPPSSAPPSAATWTSSASSSTAAARIPTLPAWPGIRCRPPCPSAASRRTAGYLPLAGRARSGYEWTPPRTRLRAGDGMRARAP